MQTAKRVMILLAVALTGVPAMAMQTGQDNSAKSQQPAQRRFSGTRSASCIVRITVDPVIVPLDPATVQGLLYSSGVAGAAVREVMQRDSIDNPWEELIEMEWLNESSPWPSPTAGYFRESDLYSDDMMREMREMRQIYAREYAAQDEEGAAYDKEMQSQLESIYSAEYMKQTGNKDTKSRDRQNQPAGGSADSTSRYDIRPKRNPPNPPSPSRSTPVATESATIRLSVRLADGVPAADEFLAAVVENLRGTLLLAYSSCLADLRDMLEETRREHSAVVEMPEGGTDPATLVIKEQLSSIVDLSVLTPETPIAEAVEILKRSVEPPLNIVVLWNDLMAFVSVEPSTPININGMPHMRLGTALDLLVRGFPASSTKPMWRIKGDVIVIGTVMTLGESNESAGQLNVETDVRILAAQRNGLANKLQDLELTLAGQEARRRAITEQIMQTERDTERKLAQDQVTSEFENLVQLSAENLSNLRKQADAGRASGANLAQATENLTRARIELAKRREELSKQVGGGQLEQLTGEMCRIAIDRAEREAQRDILGKQLAQVQQQLAQASRFDPEAARTRMAREGLDILARRIAELQMRVANLQPPMVTTIGAN